MEHSANESVKEKEEKLKSPSLHCIDEKAYELISGLTKEGYSLKNIHALARTLELKVSLILDSGR